MSRFLVAAALLAAAMLPAGARGEPIAKVGFARQLEIPSAWETFRRPTAVHADLHAGEVFVVDGGAHRIVIFDARGLERYVIRGGATFRGGSDVAVDPEGRILVLARHEGRQEVIELDFDGADPRVIDLDLPASAGDGDGDERLVSLALSPDGATLYLLDEARRRLLLFARDGHLRATVDLAADLDERRAREMILTRVDVYLDTVLVPDPMSGRVLLFDLDGRPAGSVGIQGGTACTTGFPVAAALADDGVVYVLDRQKALISAWDRTTNRCLGEAAGIGETPGRLYQPIDLALDGDGRLYTAQGLASRVQMFEGALPAAGGRSRKFDRFEGVEP
ncbi:MAG: hypothetical protein Kow0062_15750 [Acidobacteriota bacterium]